MRTSTAVRTTAVLLGTVVLVSTLAACSSSDDGQAGPTASPTASTKASTSDFVAPPADIEKTTAECTDGAVVVDASNVDVTVGDCAKVTVTGSNSVIHLGSADQLIVEGAINDVDMKSVGAVTVTGSGNRITSDNGPKPTDEGQQNVFVKR